MATFTRNSTAFNQSGALVNTNLPRYGFTRLPAPRWTDLFDTDQIATHYTSGGDVAGTTVVSGGVLSYSGGAHATLLRSGLALADGEITVNTDQAGNGGIIFRHVDNANYYLCRVADDSSVSFHTTNLEIVRRVAGVFTSVASADITWAHGTAQQFRVTFHGSLIEVWHGNVRGLSVTDTTFTTGGVGLRNSHATAFRVLDWTVNQAQQGLMVEEGTTNVVRSNGGADPLFSSVTGWTAMGQGQSIANGVATLQSPDGIAVSGFQCILTNLPQNTLHSYAIRARHRDTSGTSTVLVLDLAAPGYDSPNQEMQVHPAQLSTSFQTFVRNGFNSELAPASVNLRIFTFSTRPIEIDFVQLEQKAFATTITDSPRAAESLTIPTAGIFTRGNWAVEGIYTPQIPMNVGNVEKTLFAYEIDGSNWLRMRVGWGGEWHFAIMSGGVQRTISSAGNAVLQGTAYHWMIAGDGTNMRLCVNGAQIGTDTAYTEPVGTMPANLFVGSRPNGTLQANGLLSNLRFSNRARTLTEHQAAFNTGQPLVVDADTTAIWYFNNNLNTILHHAGNTPVLAVPAGVFSSAAGFSYIGNTPVLAVPAGVFSSAAGFSYIGNTPVLVVPSSVRHIIISRDALALIQPILSHGRIIRYAAQGITPIQAIPTFLMATARLTASGLRFAGRLASDYHVRLLKSPVSVLPGTRDRVIVLPGRHGSLRMPPDFGERTVTLECWLAATSIAELHERLDAVRTWLNPLQGAQPLVFGRTPDRYYLATPSGGVDVGITARQGVFTVDFVCADPFAYAVAPDVVSMTISPLAHNQRGTAPADPLLRLQGVSTGVGGQEIRVTIGAQTFFYRGALTAGDWLEVDCKDMTAVRVIGSNRLNALPAVAPNSVFPTLSPGANTVVVAAAGGATWSLLQMHCRNRWL